MEKINFSLYVIIIVALIQGVAWIMHYDGQVFAFIIGAVVGSTLGFTIRLKK